MTSNSAHFFAAFVAIAFSVTLIYLLRKDHIYIKQVIFWLAIALGIIVVGVWPGSIDALGVRLGISYPPIILALMTSLVLLVKALVSDLELTRMERRLRRLSQEMALLESVCRGGAGVRKVDNSEPELSAKTRLPAERA